MAFSDSGFKAVEDLRLSSPELMFPLMVKVEPFRWRKVVLPAKRELPPFYSQKIIKRHSVTHLSPPFYGI